MSRRMRQRGFTLWELLVTLVVAGIVVGLGIPNLQEFLRNNAMAAAANELVTAVLHARSEAVKRQVPVTLCLTPDPDAAAPACHPDAFANALDTGFVVWADDTGNVDADGSPDIDDPSDGDGIFDAGETVLRRSPAPGGQITVSATAGSITYMPNGFPRRGFAPVTVLFCDERGNRPAGSG